MEEDENGKKRVGDHDQFEVGDGNVAIDIDAIGFFFFFKQKTAYEIGLGILAEPLFRSFNQILKQNAKREMRLRLGKVTVADVLAAQPVTTNLLKFMRASIKMIGVSNLQSFIASMTQKLTLSDI